MEICADFLEWLGPDTSTSVLMLLDDPADLVRVSAVSRSWRKFVVANAFCKQLCLRMCMELSHFASVFEGNDSTETLEVGSSTSLEWQILEREHRAYSYLSHCLVSPTGNGECIGDAIRASSTDNYPDESIDNTLIDSDRVNMRPSYWSSQGERDPKVPEVLTYRLRSKLCIVNEIKVQPFEAYFQYGNPIYSAKAVRFRMGCSITPEVTDDKGDGPHEKFAWTYISPEFPMVQQNRLQSFKLPRPAICIGGMIQIELLGRVQVQEMDQLYYICVCHVEVVGRPLSPVFDVDISEDPSGAILKYFPEKQTAYTEVRRSSESSGWLALRERIRVWNHPIINTLLGVAESDSDEEDEDDYEI